MKIIQIVSFANGFIRASALPIFIECKGAKTTLGESHALGMYIISTLKISEGSLYPEAIIGSI